MPTLFTKRLEIYFEKSAPKNNGPLLFIGGTDGDLRNKPNQLDSPLTEQFEVLSYDQRGLGQTSCPAGDFTMQQYADDARDLLDFLGIENIPIIGVSFGGMVAQELAIRHPNKVSKLVLCCTSSGGVGGSSYPLHELQEMDPVKRARLGMKIRDVRITDEWIKVNSESQIPSKETSSSVKIFKSKTSYLMKQLHARKQHDTYDRLKLIKAPVMLAGGKFDGVAPPKNMQALHEQINDSVYRLYEGGHAFLGQDKTAYIDIIDWLKELKP